MKSATLAAILVVLLASALPAAAESPPAFLLSWSSYGTGSGQFSGPYGVATDAAGNVYVADQANNRVQKFGCPGGGGPGGCASLVSGGQLFSAHYTTDASTIPDPPGAPVPFDSATVTLSKDAGDAIFVSGSPDSLARRDGGATISPAGTNPR